MAGVVFLLTLFFSVFLFSFIGVIVLLLKTKRQEESIRELRRRLGTFQSINKEVAPDAAVPVTGEESDASREDGVPVAGFPAPATPAEGQAVTSVKQGRLYNSLLTFIRGGNLWAAGGVILLTIGFGTLIAYLGRRGFFTVEMGIAAAAAAGLAMILSGWRFRLKRPMYFLILQGGGIGILYLSIFAAHRLTPHVGIVLSLILMSFLVPQAVLMAMFQNSQGLAILGFLGGFAAPLLLSNGEVNHLFLFTYYAVLNAGVLAIGFFRQWKGLNLLAFFFTFIPSLYWAMTKYVPEFYLGSEPFFIVFFILFTILGLRSLKSPALPPGSAGDKVSTGDQRFQHYSDLILILGTPAAMIALQWKVFSYIEHGYAIIAAAFSAFYLAITIFILKKHPAGKSYAEGYLALGTLLANLIIPLELSPGLSGALWAAEGALIFFLGLRASTWDWKGEANAQSPRRGDPRIMAAGILIHIAAAIAFISDIRLFRYAAEPKPWRSPAFSGSLIIAVSALIMAVMAEKLSSKNEEKPNPLPLIAALWGFAWWFGGWYYEFQRFLPEPENAFLVLASASAVLAWLAAALFGLKNFIAAMAPAPLTAAFMVITVLAENFDTYFSYKNELVLTHNFFSSSGLYGWLAFLLYGALTIIFFRPAAAVPQLHPKKIPQTAEPVRFRTVRIFIIVLTAVAVLSAQGRFYTMDFGLPVSWTSLAGLFPLFAALIVIPLCDRKQPPEKLLLPALPVILSVILLVWFIVTLFLRGDTSPLPFYVPVLNPLDLLEGLCIASVLYWQIVVNGNAGTQKKGRVLKQSGIIVLGDILVFIWILSILARCIHYYAGVSWRGVPGSGGFQLCLFIFSALYGILHIILGHRMKKRVPWIAGAVLVTADIAKLILFDMKDISAVPRILSFFAAGIILLFIGWAAPLPPSRQLCDTGKSAPANRGSPPEDEKQ